ncbi:MAG: tRNA(His) guanylyltransferase Thg1 family protein [Candidatus Bathyarchaeia archaeon]
MRESSSNEECKNWLKHEIFSKTCIPPETPFFLRLDGWKFKELSEAVGAEKPFDKRFAKCLVSSAKILYEKGFNPTLVYVASDELNILFADSAPFRGRIEKMDSVIVGLTSSMFTLNLQKVFGKEVVTAFDSRVVVASGNERIIEYLAWRQMNAWRNHNNAYAYWVLRKLGHKPLEIAKKVEGLKTEELHEMLFEHGLNLAKTPQWQRRGILVYKEPFLKKIGEHHVTRRRVKENWRLPLFTSKQGKKLLEQIIKWHISQKQEKAKT